MAIGGGGNVGGANFEITASEGKPSVEDILKSINAAVKQETDSINKAFESAIAASEKFAQTKGGILVPQSTLDDLKAAEEGLNQVKAAADEAGQALSQGLTQGISSEGIDQLRDDITSLDVSQLEGSLKSVEDDLRNLDAQAKVVGETLANVFTRGIPTAPIERVQETLSSIDTEKIKDSITDVGAAAQEAGSTMGSAFSEGADAAARLGETLDDVATKTPKKSTFVPPGATKDIDAVADSYEKVAAAKQKIEKDDAFKAHQAAAREASKATDGATAAVTEFAQANENASNKVRELQKERKLMSDASGNLIPVEDDGAKGLKTDLIEISKRLKQINVDAKTLITTLGKDAAAPGLAKLRAEAEALHKQTGTSFKGFTGDIATTTKATSFLGRALESINGTLAQTGLDVRSISVLMGAGLAGGIAGVIKVVTDLTKRLADFLGGLIEVQRQTDLTFGEFSGQVQAFANAAGREIGRTEGDLLKLANAFAALGRSINVPESALASFSTGLAQAASQIERGLPGFKGLESVQQTIASAAKGSAEAFRALGITLDEQVTISLDTFGRLPDQLTAAEQAVLAYKAAVEAANQAVAEGGRTSASIWEHVKNLIIEAGELVGDFITRDQQDRFDEIFDLLNSLGSDEGFIPGDIFNPERIKQVTDDLGTLGDKQLEHLRIVATQVIPASKAQASAQRDIIAAIEAEQKRRAELIETQNKATAAYEASTEAVRQNEQAFLSSTSALRRAEDAFRNLARAEEDGVRRIKEAQQSLQRVREDVPRKVAKTHRDTQRAIDDANKRLLKSEEKLQRERQDRLRDIEQLEFDHNRKLEDLQLKHDRALEDSSRRAKQVRDDSVRDIVEAQIAIEQAMLKGDASAEAAARRALARALQQGKVATEALALDRAREQEDFDRDLSRAREDRLRALGKLEIETNRKIRDAHLEVLDALTQRNRAVEDAIQALHDLEIENNRALRDAAKGVEDANRDMQRSIDDAKRELARLAADYGLTEEAVRRLVALHREWKDELGGVTESLRAYLDLLEHAQNDPLFLFVPGQVPNVQDRNYHGGPYQAGHPFWAGEHGKAELIIPGQAGTVASNAQILEALQRLGEGKMGATGGPSIVVNEVANDPEATAFAIAARLTRGLN